LLESLHLNRPASLIVDVLDEQDRPSHFELAIPPTPRLLIAGAGHVGQALAAIVAQFDYAITVIDDRADFATAARFPTARCIVGDIDLELSRYPIDESTYVVIVTRGHKHDAVSLAAVIQSAARYIGLIGSKRKVRTILDELHLRGIPREQLARVHAPIGLEIGAVTPAEIAVSIAAELIAVRRGMEGKSAAPMKMSAEQLDRWLDRTCRNTTHAVPGVVEDKEES
jgi:xanthine dehydrogenase accessory factor